MRSDVIVIGGGAAGLMAAGTAAGEGLDVILVERNDKVGRKIMITGKGRCNVTNDCNDIHKLISNIPRNGRFLYGALTRFMPEDTVAFFEDKGVKLKVERGNRVFPVSDKSSDIVDCLYHFVSSKCRIINSRVKDLIIDDGCIKGVIDYDGKSYYADKVIVATGGVSYPATGSDGDGYSLAKQAGHRIIETVPSLVPLEAHEGFCSRLMGLSLRNVTVKLIDTKKNNSVLYSELGEMLFTHFGISGPLILSASAHIPEMEKGRYIISVDLKPALTHEQLDARILRDFEENINRNYINSLNSLLPKKLVPVIGELSGIPFGTKVNQITREQRLGLVALLKNFTITVTGFRPIDEAVITRGGVDVKEINPSTMESKIIRGLYFAGEVIDTDAYTGGFNLQIAFSTGRLAGISCTKE